MLLNKSVFFVVVFLQIVSDGDQIQLIGDALKPCPCEASESHVFLDDSECTFNLDGSLDAKFYSEWTLKIFSYGCFHFIPFFIDVYFSFVFAFLALAFKFAPFARHAFIHLDFMGAFYVLALYSFTVCEFAPLRT